MITITFRLFLTTEIIGKLTKAVTSSEHTVNVIASEKGIQCQILFDKQLKKAKEELIRVQKELKGKTDIVQKTFTDIVSATQAEIHALKDPFLLVIENENLFIKSVSIDPASDVFDLVFYYQKHYIIGLLYEWLREDFMMERLKVIVDEE